VSSELDTIASGSADGSVIVYTLRSGQYIRSIEHPARHAVDLVSLNARGCIVLYSLRDQSLHACSINHHRNQPPLASALAGERLNAIVFNGAGDVLLTAGDGGLVTVRSPLDLSVIQRLGPGPALPGAAEARLSPLRSLGLAHDEQFVLAGTQQGTLLVWGLQPKVVARNIVTQLDKTLGLGF